jgi:uncharacterized protein YggE
MNRKMTKVATIGSLLVVLLAAVLLGGNWFAGEAGAQTQPESTERLVNVTGYGRVAAQPDLAIIRVGVQTEADTAAEAMDENNTLMQAVISATVAAEIDEADIQTQGIRLNPVYGSSEGGAPANITGYQASNIVEVIVRDLDSLGTLLDSVVEAGGNTIESIRFEVSDMSELLAQAREAAMNDARNKAEQLTSLADAELGEVLTITEFSQSSPIPVVSDTIAVGSAAPIQPGTEYVETTVQVVWRIQ